MTALLNMECSEEDIYTITGYDLDWRLVGRRLLNDQKVRDIDCEGSSEKVKRDIMLLEWKKTKSHDATYQALVKVLRAIGNNATADRVEELERKRKPQGNKWFTLTCIATNTALLHVVIKHALQASKCFLFPNVIRAGSRIAPSRTHFCCPKGPTKFTLHQAH